MEGPTTIGIDKTDFFLSFIGLAPQDLTYAGEPTRLEIGDHNEIREFVRSIAVCKGGGLTRIGDHNLIMALHTRRARLPERQPHNNGQGRHTRRTCHRRRLGQCRCAVSSASFRANWKHIPSSAVALDYGDVLPFSKTSAERGTHAYGLNAIGLERRGFSEERIKKLQQRLYRLLLASKLNTSQALEKMKAEADRGEDVDRLIRFIAESDRGVIKVMSAHVGAAAPRLSSARSAQQFWAWSSELCSAGQRGPLSQDGSCQ